ncbi:MAG: hypothetical protein SFY67_19070 [Candidatus Melainabacteria bacterium]|nr:hypothetical protein [Candidatus Melainabacteria bacterium]
MTTGQDTGGEAAASDKAVATQNDAVAPVVETYTPLTVATLKPEAVPVRADASTLNLDSSIYRRETADKRGIATDTNRIPSEDPKAGSVMERLLKGDKSTPTVDSDYLDPKKQLEVFKRSQPGMTDEQALKYQQDILKRLSEKGDRLNGTPEEQLARMTQALDAILDPTKAGAGNQALDRMSEADRKNLVKDFLMRMSNPEAFVNQGAHNTCALNSMQKLVMQGNDPAKLAEQLAGVVNNGFTYVTNPETGQPQKVEVHSASLRPDHESRRPPTDTGDNQTRGMAGQAIDALLGQMAADNQGRIDGKKYVYLAANAGDFTGGSRSQTGEGLFEANNQGALTRFVDDSPQMTLVAKAQLARGLDLPPGVNFIHSSMINEIPPSMIDQFTVFHDETELKAKFAEYTRLTGMKTAEMRVNAPYLPGQRMAGHGLHSVNISIDSAGVKVDNHWGDGHDLTLSKLQLETATDSNRWGPMPPSVYRPGEPRTPQNIIDGPTRLSTLPTANESPDQYRQRMEQLRAEQEAKVKELGKERDKPETTSVRRKELNNEIANTELIKEAFDRAFKQYRFALKDWQDSGGVDKDAPTLSSFLNWEMARVKLS